MTPAELLASLEGNDDPDAMVLRHMAQNGADLRKPHAPDFTFDVDGEPAASALAADLAELDYTVAIYPPDADNPTYLVVAQRTMILELTAVMQLSRQFEALAHRHGASYDGWGAEIVE